MEKSSLIHRTRNAKDFSSVCILVVLLLLRIVYLGGIRFVTRPDYPDWLLPSEMFLTYFLTATLIYLQRNRLAEFHITRLSLLLFISAPLLEPFVSFLMREWIQMPYSNLFRIGVAIVAIVLLIAMLASRRDIKLGYDRLHWIAVSLVIGVFLAFVYGLSFEFLDFGRIGVRDIILKPPATISDVVLILCAQLINAAIMEEPLFRGFLWGYLRKWGYSDLRILFIQGFLFWIAHIYYLGWVPFSFWFLVPSAGIVLGLLAWKSRSIAPSIITHSLINGLSRFVSSRTLYFWW